MDKDMKPDTAPCPLCGVEVVGARDVEGRFFSVRGTDHAPDCANRSVLGFHVAPPVSGTAAQIVDLATNLCIAWERGRLEANRALWPRLRDALESAGLLGVYGESTRTLRPTLKVLVEEWQAASAVCKAAFEKYVHAARRELGAVGGRASAAANERGYVHEFILHEGMPCEGGGRGEPVHPEVGSLLLQLQRDHREAALAQNAAVEAIRVYVRERSGGKDEPEHVALSLLRDEGAVR